MAHRTDANLNKKNAYNSALSAVICMYKIKQMRFFTLIILFLICSCLTSKAQTTGCLLPDNSVYTSKVDPGLLNAALALLLGSTPAYYNSPSTPLSAQCSWAATTSTVACKVCPGSYNTFLGLITGCSVSFVDGVEGTFVMDCDIDQYTWALIFGGSVLGFYLIRRKGFL